MTWLINEARALENKVRGLTVSDSSGPNRPVEVYFRTPEDEVRETKFPSVVLEYTGVNKADDREHRGVTLLPYIPEEFQPGPVPTISADGNPSTFDPGAVDGQDYDPNTSPFKVADFPVPYNVDFKVTLYSRFQVELMSLVTQLALIDRFPARFGYLEVPENGTVRSLDLMAGPEILNGRDAEGRRLFQAVYSVRVPTELNLYGVQQITTRINTVDLTLREFTPTSS